MSSDEDDFEVVVAGAESNDDDSEIMSHSDSYEDLEDSISLSSVEEDLLELNNQKSQTELISMDEETLKSSLKDLIQLSCCR